MSIKGRNSVANLPKFKLITAFMHVLVTCKNKEDPIKNKSSEPHGLREEDFFYIFSYCMTMGDDDPQGMANLDPRGMIGRCRVPLNIATHKIYKLKALCF